MKSLKTALLTTALVSGNALAGSAGIKIGAGLRIDGRAEYVNAKSAISKDAAFSEMFQSGSFLFDYFDDNGNKINLGGQNIARTKIENDSAAQADQRCQLDETIYTKNRNAHYSLKGSCDFTSADFERAAEIVYMVLTYEALKSKGMENQFSAKYVDMVKRNTQQDPAAKQQVIAATAAYIENTYRIDEKEISYDAANAKLQINIDRKLKVSNAQRANGKLLKFSVDKKQIKEIYEKVMPIQMAEAIDVLQTTNYALASQQGIGNAEFYFDIEATQFDCFATTRQTIACDQDMNIQVGFKSENIPLED